MASPFSHPFRRRAEASRPIRTSQADVTEPEPIQSRERSSFAESARVLFMAMTSSALSNPWNQLRLTSSTPPSETIAQEPLG